MGVFSRAGIIYRGNNMSFEFQHLWSQGSYILLLFAYFLIFKMGIVTVFSGV